MFIKKSTLRRMLNTAYKTQGLYIDNDGEGYRIKGSYWDLWVKRDKLPKEYKADIVSLIGDLPEIGSGGSYTKDGIQQEMPGESPRDIAEKEGGLYIDTGVIVVSPRGEILRLLQSPKDCETMFIYNYIAEGISNSIVDSENGETQAEGMYNPYDNMLMLKNNVMVFVTYARNEPCLHKFKTLMENYWVRSLINPETEDEPEEENEEET